MTQVQVRGGQRGLPFVYRSQLSVAAQGSATQSFKVTDYNFLCQRMYAVAYHDDGSNTKIHSDRTENTDRILVNVQTKSQNFMSDPIDLFAFNNSFNDPTWPMQWLIPTNTELTIQVSHSAVTNYNYANNLIVEITFAGTNIRG